VGAERVESGAIDPAWRTLERSTASRFRPAARVVTDDSLSKLLGRQVARGASAPPSADPMAAYEEPGEWKRTEVEAAFDATGTLVGARVVEPSGCAELDDQALAAVRQTLEASPMSHAGKTVVRLALEAGVAVQPPTFGPATLQHPTGGGATVNFKLKFDESHGTVEPKLWFKQQVKTKVTLLFVAAAAD
jgi:hypothetical protein